MASLPKGVSGALRLRVAVGREFCDFEIQAVDPTATMALGIFTRKQGNRGQSRMA